jgi:hypothetical protein
METDDCTRCARRPISEIPTDRAVWAVVLRCSNLEQRTRLEQRSAEQRSLSSAQLFTAKAGTQPYRRSSIPPASVSK